MQTFETLRKGKKILTHYYGRKDKQAFRAVCDAVVKKEHPTGIDSEFNPGHVMEIFSFCTEDRVRHVPHADLFPIFFQFVKERMPHLIYQNFKDDYYVFEKALIARGVSKKLARQVLMDSFHQDVMVTDFVHDEVDPQHGLKHQERKWLNRPRKEYQELFFYIPKGKKTKITMQPHTILRSLPEDALAIRSKEEWFKLFITYAGDDAEGTRDLYPVHRAYMEKIGYWERFNAPMGDVEWTRTLTKVQERGVCVDPIYFEGIRQQVVCAQQRLRHRMRCASGMPNFNPSSTPQKQHLFFKKLRWPTRPDMMTKGGSPSLDREAMSWYAEEHGFGLAKLMLAFTREESTRRSVEAILAGVKLEKYTAPDGSKHWISKLYTSFSQISADTGRISSRKVREKVEVKKVLKNGTVKLETKTVESGLQLQNVPVRVEKDPYRIRRGFISPPGRKLIVSDYSGIELLTTILWAVKFAKRSRMLDVLLEYKTPSAIHGLTAIAVHELSRKLNPLEVKEKHPDQYADGKTCNFNLIFGGTWKVLCRVLGIDYRVPRNEELTRRMVRVWFETWPEMDVYQREIVNLGYEQGWVPIIDGRRAHVDQGLCSDHEGTRSYWERKCKNTPAQGSAAVFMKIAANFMENCPNLQKMGARQLLWVHDEAILDAPNENAEEAKIQVVKHMVAAGKYTKILKYQPPFDLVVSAKIANNWLAAK